MIGRNYKIYVYEHGGRISSIKGTTKMVTPFTCMSKANIFCVEGKHCCIRIIFRHCKSLPVILIHWVKHLYMQLDSQFVQKHTIKV